MLTLRQFFVIIANMNKSVLFTELYNRYGAVKRARGSFLYTSKGMRVTDLYLEAGRAILGWEGGSAFTMMKNIISRGQTGSFICEDKPSYRLQKAVSELFASDRTVFCFSSMQAAFDAGLSLFPDGTSVYRPWNLQNEKINIAETAALIFTPPLPWAETNFILALDTKRLQENPEKLLLIRGAVKLPFALETAYTRSIYNLIKALQERTEKDWTLYLQNTGSAGGHIFTRKYRRSVMKTSFFTVWTAVFLSARIIIILQLYLLVQTRAFSPN